MADKEINIKVTTETDVAELENLNNILDTTIGKAGDELKTAFDEANSKVEELSETLAQIEMGEIDGDFDAVSAELEEATAKADELSEALSQIDGSNLDDLASSGDDATASLNDTADAVNEISDSMGLIESTMLMDMASQIGAIGDQAEGMAQELDTASISVGQLATNSGIAEPQMRELIAHISNVTFPQNEAIAYVNLLNQMGVSADKLGDSATNMDRINDATGMGYDKVMLLTQGLQSMGVTADNLPSAFNAIAYAEANVGGGAETLQMVLRRQAGTLNEYGMNVDATVVALSALQRKTGLTGMKLGSEFGSRLKDCNGDLSALEKSLGLSAGALSKAGTETGKYSGKLQQLADEEMEHKTITERLNAVWEDFALQMDWLISPLGSVIGLIGSFGQFALSANSIITLAKTFGILQTATEAETISQWSLNTAILANPITWLVIAIVALILVLGYLYFNNEQVRQAIDALGASFLWVAQQIYDVLAGAIQWLSDLFNQFTQQLGLDTNNWIQAIVGFIMFIPTLPIQLGIALANAIAKTLGFGNNFVQTIISAGVNAVTGFINAISQMGQALVQEFNNMLQSALDFAGRLPQIIWDTAVKMVWSWVGGSGEHSPGYMSEAFEGDIGYMENRALSSSLPNNIGNVAKDMVDSFNPNLSKTNITSNNEEIITGLNNGGFVQNNEFIFNDTVVDNEDRLEYICDYITKRIAWNNRTAGRTI